MCQTFLSPPFDLIVEKFDDSAMEFFGTFFQFTGRRRGIYFLYIFFTCEKKKKTLVKNHHE